MIRDRQGKKVQIKIFPPGTEVYAISRFSNDNGPTDHLAIYRAIVEGVTCQNSDDNEMCINYWLKTPSGHEWGDEVDEFSVSDDFDELMEMVKKEWIENSDTFGEIIKK